VSIVRTDTCTCTGALWPNCAGISLAETLSPTSQVPSRDRIVRFARTEKAEQRRAEQRAVGIQHVRITHLWQKSARAARGSRSCRIPPAAIEQRALGLPLAIIPAAVSSRISASDRFSALFASPSRNPSASPTVAIWSPLSQKRQKQHHILCSHKDGWRYR
jgi:hypothetical protein